MAVSERALHKASEDVRVLRLPGDGLGRLIPKRFAAFRYARLCVAMGAALMMAGASEASAQTTASQGPKPAQIDRNGVLILVRSTLLALDHANKTGNYTVLRDLGSAGFQANSAARLGEIFAKLRTDNLDLSGVAVIEPQLSLLPQIEANGLLHMTGLFPSVPTQVNFDLMFAPTNGQWRLFGISVSLGQSAPVAPATAEKPPIADNAKPAGPVKPASPAKRTPPENKPANQNPK